MSEALSHPITKPEVFGWNSRPMSQDVAAEPTGPEHCAGTHFVKRVERNQEIPHPLGKGCITASLRTADAMRFVRNVRNVWDPLGVLSLHPRPTAFDSSAKGVVQPQRD